jgi:LacI family transcriptional regulator, repressor for deo operon, udp, cdd, tsx, nupC, and nupG
MLGKNWMVLETLSGYGQSTMASIGDVAARAGVSVATVSRALRGLPNVAPSTRERVLAAAQELRYVADPYAARLAAGRTKSIGMVVPLYTQWFFTQVVAGAEAVLTAAGYEVLLYNIGGVEGRKRFLAEQPFRKRVDGLICVDLPMAEADEEALKAAETPIVLVGTRSTHFSTVTIDNHAAAMVATRHLANLGHVRIGLISNLADDPLGFPAPLERRSGYRQVLADYELEPQPELDVSGNFSIHGGAEAMAQLLAAQRPPTAVFAESDEMAFGALKTIRDAGLSVPGDVSVIGFDDHDLAEFSGLTTIAQPVVGQGETAGELLLRQLDDGEPGVTHRELPTKLIVRSTTGPVPTLRRPVA